MSDKELHWIASLPKADLAYIGPGSKDAPCAACGVEVVVAPSSQRAIAAGQVKGVICFRCAFKEADARGEEIQPMILEEAIEEVADGIANMAARRTGNVS